MTPLELDTSDYGDCPTCGAESGYPCGHPVFAEDEWVEPLAPSAEAQADAARNEYEEQHADR